MISQKNTKVKLNLEKTPKNHILPKTAESESVLPSESSILDKFMRLSKNSSKYSLMNESGVDVGSAATSIFNQLGMVVKDFNGDPLAHANVLKRVNLYLERFPEVEYLIDMISSSVIYSSSSNTRKIQFILNGEYKKLVKEKQQLSTDSSSTDSSTYNPKIEISDINTTQIDKVDSWYEELNLEVGNLFKKNNIKLSLYGLMNSITKYGRGLFYVADPVKQTEVSFYSLDEVEFELEKEKVSTNIIVNELENDTENIFVSTPENDEIKKFNTNKVTIKLLEDGTLLKPTNLYFVNERSIHGRSMIIKIIHYLKIIELLELSLLIERLAKSKTTHIWKLDLSKVEEEDIAPTMMLYRNLLKNQMSLNYDEDNDGMQLDIVKNLVDNNLLVPTEDKNLDISTLKSEFKPLLDDVNYYWDKVYLALGIPLHYRKGGDSKAYVNNNMLIMHDNVYSMKISHYQLIINNLLTFWIENWLKANHPKLTIKYLNVNIPEFIPISERKETDLDKASKFVTMFTQLEQMLGLKIKEDFILSKLFPNDIVSDIVDIQDEAEVEADLEDMTSEDTNQDVVSLFESSHKKFSESRNGIKIKNITNHGKYNLIKYKLRLNVDW